MGHHPHCANDDPLREKIIMSVITAKDFEAEYLGDWTPEPPTITDWLRDRKLPSPSVFFNWRDLSAKELDLLDWLMMKKSTELDDDNKDGVIFWISNERIRKLFPEVDIDELLEIGYLLSPITPDEFYDLGRFLGKEKLALLHARVYTRKDVTCLSRQGVARIIFITKRPFEKEGHNVIAHWFEPPPVSNNPQFVATEPLPFRTKSEGIIVSRQMLEEAFNMADIEYENYIKKQNTDTA